MKFVKLLLSLVLICFLVTSCNLFEPSPVDYHNKILFTSRRSGEQQIYMINPNGRGLTQITYGPFEHNNAWWSPDAQQLICSTTENNSSLGLYLVLMNSDTTGRELLTRGHVLDWSPDSDHLYFNPGYMNNSFYSYDISNDNYSLLSSEHSGYCSISPEGDKIIFCHDSDIHDGFTVLNFPEFDEPQHFEQEGVFPSYSHSGEKIVFAHNDSDTEGYGTIYIMNSDGSNSLKLVEESTELQYYYPKWSPDDEKIIFLSSDNMGNWYLWMVNSDGTDFHKVINDNTVTSCDW